MKKTCHKYTDEEISRFVDNELPRNRYHEMAQHCSHCADCRRIIEQYRSMSSVFNNHADQQILKVDASKLSRKVAQITQQSKQKKAGSGFFGKNIYLKLASVAAILMISLFTMQNGLFGPSGPSAIVKSVDTEFASVMIIETQKEKHTIIWFSET